MGMTSADMLLAGSLARMHSDREQAANTAHAQGIINEVAKERDAWSSRCRQLEQRLAELDKTFVSTDILLAKAIERTRDLGQALRSYDPNHPVLSPTVRDMTCRRAAMERIKVYAGEYRYDAVNDVVERIRK